MLLTKITGLPIYFFILLVNIPFIFFGYHQIGKNFTIKTILAITGLALCLALVEYPMITHDKLLVAVFGGFFLEQELASLFGEVRYWMEQKYWQYLSAKKPMLP